MYVIKHVPEDFAVTEVSTVNMKNTGRFLYFRLLKRDYNTLDALNRVAAGLRVSPSALSCAGNKDKIAVTAQTCSVKGVSKQALENLQLKDISVSFLGFGDEPVHLGDLEGNQFRIIVRNLDSLPNMVPRFRNLFGEQRFSEKNADIGCAIVKRDFERAARLISDIDPSIQSYFARNDWIGALRRIPRKVLILFVHAYQSYLWNRAAMVSDAQVLPVVGFGTVVVDEVTQRVLGEEGVSPSDFVVRELPEVSAEGSERSVWVEAKDLKVGELEPDEFFEGKKKVALDFFLPKGSYATEFIRQSFGQ